MNDKTKIVFRHEDRRVMELAPLYSQDESISSRTDQQ